VSDGAKRFRGNPRRRKLSLSYWAIGTEGGSMAVRPARASQVQETLLYELLVNPKRVSLMLGEIRCTARRARHLHPPPPNGEPTGGGEPPVSIQPTTQTQTIHKVFGCLGANIAPFRCKFVTSGPQGIPILYELPPSTVVETPREQNTVLGIEDLMRTVL